MSLPESVREELELFLVDQDLQPGYQAFASMRLIEIVERLVAEARAEAWSVGWADGRLSMEREMGD